jgi:glycosyltransferase involved in cell wall biosynthesis
MSNPKVSVIIPNYNHAKYLDQRIQSVLNQTYQDFEIIILDDCSPDNGASRAVIEKYRSNPHVSHIVYNEKNSGSTFIQWQKGFSLAKGEIMWIAESDDWCELNFLETLMPYWEKYPDCSVIETSLWDVDSDGNKIYPEKYYSGETIHTDGKEFIKWNLIQSNFYIPNASAVTFRKDIAMSLPSDYMEYKAAGDRLFWIYMLERGNMCKVYKPLSYFRQHAVKVTQKKERDGTQGRENYKINQYLKRQGYIKGLIAVEAFKYYWNNFMTSQYDSEEVRQELLHLWFPWWQRTLLYRAYIDAYYIIYGELYKLKHKMLDK